MPEAPGALASFFRSSSLSRKRRADEFRRPEVGDVQVVGGIVPRCRARWGPLGADHAEVTELLAFIEAGRCSAHTQGRRLSQGHGVLLFRAPMEMILAPHPR